MRYSILLLCSLLAPALLAQEVDVLVYGATPAGIAAALAAAEEGEKVLLVEKTDQIGGMLANGVSHADVRSFEALTGTFLKFTQRVQEEYRPEFGKEAETVCARGTKWEPKVAQRVFEKMLAEEPAITLRQEWALEAVNSSSDAESNDPEALRAVEVCLFADARGDRHSVAARFFIDATYEGDLLAALAAPYRVGREATDIYGEMLAPDEDDGAVQGYNHRLCMTRDPETRVPVRLPADYEREDFSGVLPLIAKGIVTAAFGTNPSCIFNLRASPLPHGKFEVDDMPHGTVRLSLPGANEGWPDGGGGVALRGGVDATLSAPPFSRVGLARTREEITREHEKWTVGLLYFLQNDAAVPEPFRKAARQWGWSRDEYRDNGHIPNQLYVREARRLLGRHVFTESDWATEPGDCRALLHEDAIAIGDYGPSCIGATHAGARFGGEHGGEFVQRVPPYQVPYGVLVPRNFENLLVTCAISSSHVGFCALRFEPIWTSIGQAAGYAAHFAHQRRTVVANVPVPELQARLHRAGAATIYVSDVPPASADFRAVQWWGDAGGFHGIEAPLPKPPDGEEKSAADSPAAYPRHAARLDEPLDTEVAAKWDRLAKDLGIAVPAAAGGVKTTRGDYIRAAWKVAGSP